jgi:hypothetical protein
MPKVVFDLYQHELPILACMFNLPTLHILVTLSNLTILSALITGSTILNPSQAVLPSPTLVIPSQPHHKLKWTNDVNVYFFMYYILTK